MRGPHPGRDGIGGDATRLGLGLLACHTALLVAKTRGSVDIGHLIEMLRWDLDVVADFCPHVAKAMGIIASQLGGEEDTMDPGMVVARLTELRKGVRTALLGGLDGRSALSE
jgi:hypothetical protein